MKIKNLNSKKLGNSCKISEFKFRKLEKMNDKNKKIEIYKNEKIKINKN